MKSHGIHFPKIVSNTLQSIDYKQKIPVWMSQAIQKNLNQKKVNIIPNSAMQLLLTFLVSILLFFQSSLFSQQWDEELPPVQNCNLFPIFSP